MARDDRTCAQLQEFLEVGSTVLLERAFKRYLEAKQFQQLKQRESANKFNININNNNNNNNNNYNNSRGGYKNQRWGKGGRGGKNSNRRNNDKKNTVQPPPNYTNLLKMFEPSSQQVADKQKATSV